MRNAYHKPQHEVFIRCMLLHGDPTNAYRTAYPKATKTSARIGGIRLNSYPHIRQRIQPILEQRHKEADRLTTELALARLKAEAIRRDQIRSILCHMANGEIKKNRHFMVDGQEVTVQEDISHRTLINLISLDLKLAEGYNNWPSIERQFAELTHNCVVFENRQQTVINSESNPISATVSANRTHLENLPKADNKTNTDNKILGLERYFDTSPPSYKTYKENIVNNHWFYNKN